MLDKAVYENFYKQYIDLVPENEWRSALVNEAESMSGFIAGIPESKGEHRYAENKWSIKEILMHLLDCERIMSYRALCFARGDKTELPGFDEKEYGTRSNASAQSLSVLEKSYRTQRASSIQMFETFTDNMMDLQGTANGILLSGRALAFIIAGHAYHHRNVIRERYL